MYVRVLVILDTFHAEFFFVYKIFAFKYSCGSWATHETKRKKMFVVEQIFVFNFCGWPARWKKEYSHNESTQNYGICMYMYMYVCMYIHTCT